MRRFKGSATLICLCLANLLVQSIGCDSSDDDGRGTDTDSSDTDTDSDTESDTSSDSNGLDATLLWSEDFETGDYARWTSTDYGNDWNGGLCHGNGFSSESSVRPGHSHRSEITCTIDQSHRGYGGLQFDGDAVLSAYTNNGQGIEAPFGVVNTYWSMLEVPYSFGNGKWFSFWTVNNDCGWTDRVITLGLENSSNRLTPAHIRNTGGSVEFAKDAPTFPLNQWVRTTIYINYHTGVMHIWQDGQELCHATFSRSDTDICQWHWGAYASGDNDNIVLWEDDNQIWKLNEPITDFSTEPQLK